MIWYSPLKYIIKEIFENLAKALVINLKEFTVST